MILPLSICDTSPRDLTHEEWATQGPTQTEFGRLTYLCESAQSQPFLFVSTMLKMPKMCFRMPRFATSRGIFFRRGKNGGSGQFSRACARQDWRSEAAGS